MRISIHVAPHAGPEEPRRPASALERVVAAADEMGVDTVWVADRLTRTGGQDARTGGPDTRTGGQDRSPDEAVLDAYATLGFLASRSERVRLGTLASPVGHREPRLLIDAVTALDAVSGGRAWLGLGTGYAGREATTRDVKTPAATDRPAPAGPERYERIEDLLRLAHQVWSGDDSPYRGAHCDLGRPYAGPRPLSGPHPPVLISGNGEPRMLPLVARYADACTLLDVPGGGATLRRKLDILAVHCRKVGRPVGDIDTSVSTGLRPEESVDELVAHCRHFAGLGIGHVVLVPAGPWTERSLRSLAAALPVIRGLHRNPHRDPHRDPHRTDEPVGTGAGAAVPDSAPTLGAPV
jgi:alkanesulfonate monooxygenase SsuD/methylene tetrahydromethanopterin reductase-like flavin-dependent oxidoreductase (luciferase family)